MSAIIVALVYINTICINDHNHTTSLWHWSSTAAALELYTSATARDSSSLPNDSFFFRLNVCQCCLEARRYIERALPRVARGSSSNSSIAPGYNQQHPKKKLLKFMNQKRVR